MSKKKLLIFLFFGVFILFLLAFVSSQSPEQDDTGPADEKELWDSLNGLISQADSLVNQAFSLLLDDKFDAAREKIAQSKKVLLQLKLTAAAYQESISENDFKLLSTFIDYEDRWGKTLYKEANVTEATQKVLEKLNQGASLSELVPQLEILERGSREDGNNWKRLAQYVESIKDFREKYGITDENVQVLYTLADNSFKFADDLKALINKNAQDNPDYVSVHKRNIAPPQESQDLPKYAGLINEELKNLFASFDKDKNKKISIGEAQDFYYWVENNITYRYDDENEPNPFVGTLVGDGREGFDYRQKPLETFREKAGDCEDMSTLEQAFYTYYNIPAYVAGVNALSPDVIDHAATIVWIADKVDLFKKTLGDLVYYKIEEGAKDIYGNPMRPGYYMLVDNAYSGAFGYLSEGLSPGTFKVHCTIPLEKGYGKEWNRLVNSCGVEMR